MYELEDEVERVEEEERESGSRGKAKRNGERREGGRFREKVVEECKE